MSGAMSAYGTKQTCRDRARMSAVEGKTDITNPLRRVPFDDIGEQSLKNIARPVRVYRVEFGGQKRIQLSAPALALPDKPSIAVLPFQNMSGDAEQDYFCDGWSRTSSRPCRG